MKSPRKTAKRLVDFRKKSASHSKSHTNRSKLRGGHDAGEAGRLSPRAGEPLTLRRLSRHSSQSRRRDASQPHITTAVVEPAQKPQNDTADPEVPVGADEVETDRPPLLGPCNESFTTMYRRVKGALAAAKEAVTPDDTAQRRFEDGQTPLVIDPKVLITPECGPSASEVPSGTPAAEPIVAVIAHPLQSLETGEKVNGDAAVKSELEPVTTKKSQETKWKVSTVKLQSEAVTRKSIPAMKRVTVPESDRLAVVETTTTDTATAGTPVSAVETRDSVKTGAEPPEKRPKKSEVPPADPLPSNAPSTWDAAGVNKSNEGADVMVVSEPSKSGAEVGGTTELNKEVDGSGGSTKLSDKVDPRFPSGAAVGESAAQLSEEAAVGVASEPLMSGGVDGSSNKADQSSAKEPSTSGVDAGGSTKLSDEADLRARRAKRSRGVAAAAAASAGPATADDLRMPYSFQQKAPDTGVGGGAGPDLTDDSESNSFTMADAMFRAPKAVKWGAAMCAAMFMTMAGMVVQYRVTSREIVPLAWIPKMALLAILIMLCSLVFGSFAENRFTRRARSDGRTAREVQSLREKISKKKNSKDN